MTDDDSRSIDAELFGDEEPTGVDGSELVADHLDRCCVQEQVFAIKLM